MCNNAVQYKMTEFEILVITRDSCDLYKQTPPKAKTETSHHVLELGIFVWRSTCGINNTILY